MLYEEALQIVDSIVAQVNMSREQHVRAQMAIRTLANKYAETLETIEALMGDDQDEPEAAAKYRPAKSGDGE